MEEKFCPSCEDPVIDKYPPCPLQCMSPKCKAYKKVPVVNTSQKPVIWILGGPGSGKGTQCEKIKAKYGYTHLSTGDLLRAEVLSDTNRSMCIRNIMKRGGLVPTDIVLDILRENIKEMEPESKGFLIDGYPRNEKQGVDFEKTICVANLIIYLDCSPETMMARMSKRATQCPRIDDGEDSAKTQIKIFKENSSPILTLYSESGRLVMINAEKAVDVVFVEVVKYLDPVATATKSALDAAIAASKIPLPLPIVPETAKAYLAKKEAQKKD